MKNTGERLIPDEIGPDDSMVRTLLGQHLARYTLAAQFAKGKRVLDLACGAGYGSRLLLDFGAREVVGVDISEETIAYARDRYGIAGLQFAVGDAETFEGGRFDVVASFETLEHLTDPVKYLIRARDSILDIGGVLIVSATTIPTRDFYAFHLHDVDPDGLRSLVRGAGYKIVQEMPQHAFFGLRELGKASRYYTASFPVRRFLSRPFQGLSRGLQVMANRGFDYWNLTLVCRLF